MLLITEEKPTSARLRVFNETSDDGRNRTCVLSQQHNTVRHLQTCGKWRSASDSETSYKDSVYLQLSIPIESFLAFRGGRQDTKRKEKTAKNSQPPQEQYFSIFTVFLFLSQRQCDRGHYFHFNPPYIMRYGSKNCQLSNSSNAVLMPLTTKWSERYILITGHPAYLRNCEIRTREKRWMNELWDESDDSYNNNNNNNY